MNGKGDVGNGSFLGGGNSNIFNFHPENWGRCSPILTISYFSNGLVKNHQLVSFNILDAVVLIRSVWIGKE